MNKTIGEIVSCFNCKRAQFQSTPMLQLKQTTGGLNLRRVRGKYIPALRNPQMFFHFIAFLKRVTINGYVKKYSSSGKVGSELIFSIPTFHMGHAGDAGRAG